MELRVLSSNKRVQKRFGALEYAEYNLLKENSLEAFWSASFSGTKTFILQK